MMKPRALINIGDECKWIANLYAPYSYERPQPANVLSRDGAFTDDLLGACREWNATYTRGSSVDLFVLENGLLFNRCLYKAVGGEIVQMYETNKPGDRPWRPDLNPAKDLQEIKQPQNTAVDYFYLGSIGSENYGHWLIDDLTRASSLLEHFSPDSIPAIVLNSYNPIIDHVREQTLRALTHDVADVQVIFLKYRTAYFFPRLYYVTPSSYHPFLKCPVGIAFVRDHFIDRVARMPQGDAADSRDVDRGRRIFVTRRAIWRNVINEDAVVEHFRDRSFAIVDLEALSFIEQVRTFSRAEVVVGVMGAGMANVVFCPAGGTVVHLAPEGWKDPFFWDLAALKKQRYSVAFGEPSAPQAPSFTPFTIEPAQLAIIDGWLS